MGFWKVVLNVLKNSDVIILIADARIPEMTKNREIVKKSDLMNKKIIIVFNKIDLLSKKDIENLEKKYPDSFLVSKKDRESIDKLKKYLNKLSEKNLRKSLRVGIVGYPNVGKSTLINLLVPNAKLKVSDISGTTKKTQWIRSGFLRIIDSPGVIPAGDSAETLGLVSGKDAHKIKNPEKTALRIINFLNKKNKKILEKFYNTSAENDYDLFLKIGKKRGYLLKKGEIDEHRTAIKIIEDWQKGKISLK
jgi:hypothetical protein